MEQIQTHTTFRFRSLLRKHGMSQRKLCRLVGISPALLTMMLNGERTFQYRHKENIALVLGVQEESINWNE
jgi:transcriptional regulator with XRE-family HTH domain|tara:strand:+ start:198 stop:410 length:213 start_codon:yes stop_codon:yes gene_type:complete